VWVQFNRLVGWKSWCRSRIVVGWVWFTRWVGQLEGIVLGRWVLLGLVVIVWEVGWGLVGFLV